MSKITAALRTFLDWNAEKQPVGVIVVLKATPSNLENSKGFSSSVNSLLGSLGVSLLNQDKELCLSIYPATGAFYVRLPCSIVAALEHCDAVHKVDIAGRLQVAQTM